MQANRGSGLAIVMVAMVLLSLLATTLLNMTYVGYKVKTEDLQKKKDYYVVSTAMDEIRAGVQRIGQFLTQFFRMIPHTAIQIGQIGIEIVIHFKILSGKFVKQHPSSAAENFYVSFIVEGKARKYFVPQGFFTADPTHKAIQFAPSFLQEYFCKNIYKTKSTQTSAFFCLIFGCRHCPILL